MHEQFAGGVCGAAPCRRRALEADLIEFRQRALQSLGEPTIEAIPITVVPHRAGRVVPLDTERRSAFAKHLRDVAHEALTTEANAHAESGCGAELEDERQTQGTTAFAQVATAVCSACRGACCYHGGANAAFIDAPALKRYTLAHPTDQPEEIVAAYLAYVPERHFAGSCVYHTASGCNLPRRMRAAICNAYACKGLNNALAMPGDGDPSRRFIVARLDNRIVRGVLTDGKRSYEVFNGAAAETSTAPGCEA